MFFINEGGCRRFGQTGLIKRLLVLGVAVAAPVALVVGLLLPSAASASGTQARVSATRVILHPPSSEPVDRTPLFTPPTTCHGGTGD